MNTPIVDAVNSRINQFYPTPAELVQTMCDMVDWKRVHNVLEPSAGKGDIADYIAQRYGRDNIRISCVEIDKELCKILRSNEHSVYNGDFMQYTSTIPYDCVVMNPPFRNAVAHLLKVLRMLQTNGGQIVCLMNAMTLQHLESDNAGKELQQYIAKYKPVIKYIDAAFTVSEHPTKVRTALLYFDIPERHQSDIFENMYRAVEMQDTVVNEQNAIEVNDILKSLVKQYEIEVHCGVKLIQEYKQLAPKMLRSLKNIEYVANESILELKVAGQKVSETRYVECTRLKYWKYLFGSDDFTRLFTQSLLDNYRRQLNDFKAYEFNLQNIYQLRLDMQKQLTQSLQDSILDMFEKLTFKHSLDCESNVQYYNGWRTNDAFKINRKIIYPFANGYDDIFHKFRLSYDFKCFLMDLEHVFDYLGGTAPDSCSVRHYEARTDTFVKVTFKYFQVTQYKKGTAHIEFLNADLLKKFNLYGAMHKHWLPNSYGQKAYRNMTPEEQAVIDSFEGEKTYMTDMQNAEKRKFLLSMQTQAAIPQLPQL